MTALAPLGDSSILVRLGEEIDLATNQRVHALDAHLRQSAPRGVIETVPAYATLLVHYDPLLLTYSQAVDWLQEALSTVPQAEARPPRRIEVPVRYGGENGPDLEAVAAHHHIAPADVVRLHTGREYTVFMMGFTPGFPYMGRLDDALVTPRLETPRTRVPAGSIGIAGAQTGIYPMASPGGWRLIGRTEMRLFDLSAAEPFLFRPGDTVRFIAEGRDA